MNSLQERFFLLNNLPHRDFTRRHYTVPVDKPLLQGCRSLKMKVQEMERKLTRRSLLLVLSAIHFLGVSNIYLQLLGIITNLNKMTFEKSVFFTLNVEAYVLRV